MIDTISTYALLDLKTLAIAPEQPLIQATIHQAGQWKGPDGGINPSAPQTVAETAHNPVRPARGILCSR